MFLALLYLGLIIASAWLFWRLRRDHWRLRRKMCGIRSARDAFEPFVRPAQRQLDAALGGASGPYGCLMLPVACREAHDRHATLGQLLDHLRQYSEWNGLEELEELVKGLYQLQATLKISPDSFEPALDAFFRYARAHSMGRFQLGKTRLARVGMAIDRGWMMPITSGATVHGVLGVALYDPSGKLLRHAKVLAR